MTAKNTALFSLLLLPALLPASARAEDTDLKFSGLSYPLELQLPAGQKVGGVLLETAFCEPPQAAYDTVLLQGEMPDPGVSVTLLLRSVTSLTPAVRYQQQSFRRFPNGRFWAKYKLPLSNRPLKLSVTNSGSRGASSLTIYETDLVVEKDSREEPAAVSTAAPYVPDPALFLPDSAPFTVIRRQAWQAAPPKEPYTPHTPQYFTLHHTQAHYPKTREEAIAEMQFIQDFHQNGRGWIDIAYHFLIDPLGNIYEGRPIKALGAHVKNRNTGNIGISIMGNYHPPVHDVFTSATQDSFVAIGRYLKDTYSVDVSSFYAHRDIGNTDCPGDDLYAKKGMLRGLIFTPAQAQDLPVTPSDTPPLTPTQRKSLNQLIQYLGGR